MKFTTKCKKCGNDISVDNIRALPDGKGFVCKTCPPPTAKKHIPEALRKTIGERPVSRKVEVEPMDLSSGFFTHKNYQCTYCKYKFQRKAEHVVKVCPQCGRDKVVQVFETRASQLVDES